MDIHKSIVDIRIRFMDIKNSIYRYPYIRFIDIHKSIVDIHNYIYGYP